MVVVLYGFAIFLRKFRIVPHQGQPGVDSCLYDGRLAVIAEGFFVRGVALRSRKFGPAVYWCRNGYYNSCAACVLILKGLAPTLHVLRSGYCCCCCVGALLEVHQRFFWGGGLLEIRVGHLLQFSKGYCHFLLKTVTSKSHPWIDKGHFVHCRQRAVSVSTFFIIIVFSSCRYTVEK